ncbi:uncharacterized protein N0V89_008602 [Didymosphaeria variabile]|uniref:DUF7730 domain-containing protein n=1 Tax=Didymosphaeria variabile TaxID=1932322 RepID=A0A9W8XIF6_9PLEO|nr:uncharacterized protein N0V89_008602 [Didymosphaeria variabile]KAJ4349981.1 hypothetical protein N0V89_008602 [Didymosphaeria variabile]
MSKRVRKSAQLGAGVDDIGAGDEYQPRPKRLKAASIPKKSKKQKESRFPFLELPGEIRNMIYEHALTATDRHIDIHRVLDDDTKARTKPVRQSKYSGKRKYKDIVHQLLRVNRQIHDEATPILYSQNAFNFFDAQGLASFLGRYSLHVRDLSHVVICENLHFNRGTGQSIETAFSLLAFAENLQSLKLDLTWSKNGNVKDAAQTFYHMARNWLQAVGLRKGDKRAGMDILVFEDFWMWHGLSMPTPQRVAMFRDSLEETLMG